jgi:hypothetical protein
MTAARWVGSAAPSAIASHLEEGPSWDPPPLLSHPAPLPQGLLAFNHTAPMATLTLTSKQACFLSVIWYSTDFVHTHPLSDCTAARHTPIPMRRWLNG